MTTPTPLRRVRGSRNARSLLLAALVAALLAWPLSAAADDYDPQRAGHPLRVAAYVLHPVGVAFDWLLFRPAHWLGSLPVLRTVFGHDVEHDR